MQQNYFNFIKTKPCRPYSTNAQKTNILKQIHKNQYFPSTQKTNINTKPSYNPQTLLQDEHAQDPIKNLLYFSSNFETQKQQSYEALGGWDDHEQKAPLMKTSVIRPKTTDKQRTKVNSFISTRHKGPQKQQGECVKRRYQTKEIVHKINVGQQQKTYIKRRQNSKTKIFQLQKKNYPFINTFNCNTFKNSLDQILNVKSNNANIGPLYRRIREKQRQKWQRRQISSNLLGNYNKMLIIK